MALAADIGDDELAAFALPRHAHARETLKASAILERPRSSVRSTLQQPVQGRAATSLQIGLVEEHGTDVGSPALPCKLHACSRTRMMPLLATAALSVLRRFDPERAHGIALRALRLGLAGRDCGTDDPLLAVDVLGRHFANPIGLAAGFDKDAVAVAPLLQIGFGFVEAGTVTPLPQQGNPKPRLFRLERDQAVINRMGMNGQGLPSYVQRMAALRRGAGRVGANVGINKDQADPERDYPVLVAAVAPHVDYITINISSPNTPGMRDLQSEARLRAILRAIQTAVPDRPPLLVKIAPDLADASLADIVAACIEAGVQGLVVSNTTIARPASLADRQANEPGGLSGAPLFTPSTAVLARVYRLAAGRLVLLGCGGVTSGRDALTKIRAGASLVQLYTAFAYHGPALIPRLKAELAAALRQDGFASVAEAVGVDAREIEKKTCSI
jgi:dihydroorotate dehydrogenase